MTPTEQVDVKFVKAFKELFNEDWRAIVYYGGRGSGKSHHAALALLLRGRAKTLRILCTRELQNTIADSVHKLLADLINTYGFDDYVVTDKTIVNIVTGTEFIFKGLRHNATEIKSTEGIDIAWVEEAQSISADSLKLLVPTIRKPGSQIIYTFNRMTELDPVYVRYCMNPRPRTYVRKVNYDVLDKVGLFSDEQRLEMEEDRKTPELFAHIWLGEPQSQAELAIINRTTVLEAMNRTIEGEGQVFIGVDVARMGSDRTTFWKRKGLKTLEFEVHTKLRTTEVCDKLEVFVDFDKTIEIRIDDTGVGGGVTDEMMKRGYHIVAVNFGSEPGDKDKYPNWISEAWFHLAEVLPEAELPLDADLLMELTTRQWKQDNKGRRAVESKQDYKKRGFRSPDIADAAIICYAESSEDGFLSWMRSRSQPQEESST